MSSAQPIALERRAFSGAMKAGLNVQSSICTCMGAGLAVRRVLCTSSQFAWTCKESFARSSFREIQSMDILVPKIWYPAPHPSNDQNIAKTTPFGRQKRRFLDEVRLQDFWRQLLQAACSFEGHESKPDRVEATLYVHFKWRKCSVPCVADRSRSGSSLAPLLQYMDGYL